MLTLKTMEIQCPLSTIIVNENPRSAKYLHSDILLLERTLSKRMLQVRYFKTLHHNGNTTRKLLRNLSLIWMFLQLHKRLNLTRKLSQIGGNTIE